MYISMFPSPTVYSILMHSDLWSVEYRWLIHVVPCEEVYGGAFILIWCQHPCPPFTYFRPGEV